MPHATHAILRSDPTARNKTPAQRLFDAALVGNLDRVTALLQQGVDANAVDAYGTTPLIAAARGGHHRISALLIASGADPDKADLGGTPLHAAVRKVHPEIVRLLLLGHASPDRLDRHGRLPIDAIVVGAADATAAERTIGSLLAGSEGAGLAEKREMRERARVDEAARRLERAEIEDGLKAAAEAADAADEADAAAAMRRDAEQRRLTRPHAWVGVPRPMTAPETPAAPAPTPVDAEAEAARLRARETYRKQAEWRGRFNPLLGRARPDYAPGETFTAPAVPLDPPPAGVKSMSGFERYCEPPKPPPRILRPREAPPQLVVAPPAGQAMAKMRPRR